MAERKIFDGLFFPLWNAESLFLFFIIFLICFSPFVLATDRYVYPPQSSSRPALSFAGVVVQYPHIQAAIDDSEDGDIIYLAPGRFTGFGNRDLDYHGKAITISGLDPNDANVIAATIIDCNGSETDKHRGFYFHTGEDTNSVLCGITVTNGLHDYGSAVYCDQSSPYIHHCNFTANTGRYGSGAAIYLGRSSSVLSESTIADNNVGNAVNLAGYYNDSNTTIVQNCIIKNNFANGSSGGIYCSGGNNEVINCKIEGNKSYGIQIRSGTMKISDCQIIGNGTRGSQFSVGGIYNMDGRGGVTVENSSIIGNGGAGVVRCEEINNCFIGYNSGNGLEYCQRIMNSKIIGNGGEGINRPVGIYGPPLITNCVIAKNKGRGIYYYSGGTQNLSNCTIVENDGVGVEISNTTLNITNCIIRDNFGEQGEQIKGITPLTQVRYTNSYKTFDSPPIPIPKEPYPGIGNIDSDPCFVSDFDFHLMPDSACVDAGTNDANFVTEPNDIEGSPRIIDGNGDGIATADMGAYEYNNQQPVIAAWAERIVCFKNAGNQTEGNIFIKNCGSGILNCQIVSDCNWLTIVPSQSTSSGQVQQLNVLVDANSLELGDYFCRIKIYGENAPNSPLDLWLQVHIGSLFIVPTDFNTIQAAIDAANDFDYIRVLDGTYTGSGNTNVNFAGKDVVLQSIGGAENCIVDCQQTANGFKFISGETSETVLDGFSIINAYEYAVYCDACSSPVITNCTIADSGKDGVYMQNYRSTTINNCRFDDCLYTGLHCSSFSYCKVNVGNCEFIGGRKAITVFCRGEISIRDCNINSNYDGVQCSDAAEVSIENCVIHDCMGGGIEFVNVGELQISNLHIRNVGRWGHGLIPNDGIGIWGVIRGKISNCILTGNGSLTDISPPIPFRGEGAIHIYQGSNIVVQNCLLAGNNTGCFVTMDSQVRFENCTFAGGYGLQGSTLHCSGFSGPIKVDFVNCILGDEGNSIYQENGTGTTIDISYSDVRGGWEGLGNINIDPCFVEPGYWDSNGTPDNANDDFWVDGDYHLKSEGWRWDSQRQRWTYDGVTSRCIDAGNPGYPLGNELLTVPPDPCSLWGENLRIDMGMYGGTAEASMPPYNWSLLSDMDNSGRVDFADFSYLAGYYGEEDEKLSGDLNRNGKVDLEDISLIAADWLKSTDWAIGW